MVEIILIHDNPLTYMGQVAGLCYGVDNEKRYRKIAESCLKSGHGRVSEFVDIAFKIDGYSAKVIRELYTHIIGTTRLQESTRYVDYSDKFKYVTPPSIVNCGGVEEWHNAMETVINTINILKEKGVPAEDYSNLLPLAYVTKIAFKINLRALIHLFNLRTCSCTYHEFRRLMNDIKNEISKLGEEWKFISDNYFVTKCDVTGYCTEYRTPCQKYPLKGV